MTSEKDAKNCFKIFWKSEYCVTLKAVMLKMPSSPANYIKVAATVLSAGVVRSHADLPTLRARAKSRQQGSGKMRICGCADLRIGKMRGTVTESSTDPPTHRPCHRPYPLPTHRLLTPAAPTQRPSTPNPVFG